MTKSHDLYKQPNIFATMFSEEDNLISHKNDISKTTWKKPSYLPKVGLTMILVLCLMIYSIAEWKLRQKLEKENETVPDQKGKPTKRPTMRWIFFKFKGITELSIQNEGGIKSEVSNMEEVHWKILILRD